MVTPISACLRHHLWHTATNMSYKPLAKLFFGRDWPEIEATATNTDAAVENEGNALVPATLIEFSYDPPHGEREYGQVEVKWDSGLAGVKVGETFSVHYNPKRPADYYI